MDKDKEQIIYKRNGFRMWKSGKHWLYGLGAASAIFLSTPTQTFAEFVEPNLNLPPENQTVLADTGETGVEESSTEDSPQPVSEETLPTEELLSPANEETAPAVVEDSELVNQTVVEQETAPVANPQVEEETSEEPEETSEPSQDEDFKKKIVPISSAIFQDEASEEDKPAGEKLTKLRANQERSAEEPLDITTAKSVRIYYEPSSDTEDNYYIYVWGDGLDSSMQGQDLKMERHGDRQFKITITPKEDATSFNYIIKKGGSGIWTDKRTGDMVATVNSFTETDIYVGDNWYSQLTNLQTDDFDRKFGYEDKRVSADAEDKFETVGSLGRLGATINLWAPTAKEVSLNLYTDLSPDATASHQVQMVRGTDYNPDDHTTNTVGVWTYTISAEDLATMGIDTANKLAYDYSLTLPNSHFIQVEFTNNGKVFRNSATMESIQGELSREEIAAFYAKGGAYQTVTTQDPYSYALIQGGGRSVILDVSKVGESVTHTANEDRRASTNSQVSVLEVNVRDFSIDPSSGVSEENRGNYLGFVETGTTNPNTGAVTGIDYLKYLGVNYVQLMPVNDFETVPELDKDDPENNTISQK